VCGIFGYVGHPSLKSSRGKSAAKIVFEGLKSLEYRGYDSWGIVVRSQSGKSKLIVEKHVGKIGNSKLDSSLITHHSSLALGHTRWATHGGVTVENAHPHLDCSGKIALVHNGIVENYQELKKTLIGAGHRFKSETDTETVVHLVEEYAKNKPFAEAVRSAFLDVSGLNAFIFLSIGGQMVAVKSGTPLVIGLGKGENFISSDPSALLAHTKRAVFLKDNEIIQLTNNRVNLIDTVSEKRIKPKISNLDWKVEETKPGKFAHYMLKEIYEQPQVLAKIAANGQQIEKLAKIVEDAHGTFFVACGSASYAALSGTYLFAKIAKKHVNFSIGSEFNYLEDYIHSGSLVIPISQSGESVDVVEPVVRAKKRGAKIFAIVNVVGSTLYRTADYNLILGAGVEKAVCATKSWTAMVANLIYLTYALAGRVKDGQKIIEKAAKAVEEILTDQYLNKIKKLVMKLKNSRDVYIIGRGLSYATALEATLKLKEVCYIHSEGFAGGELKHGVIALIEKGTAAIAFAPLDETYEAIISNAIEVKSRGGYIIGVSPKPNEAFDFYLPVADCEEGSIIASVVPIQLLAYYLAVEKGLDPDKPRNLAKSVTVK